MLAKTKRLPGNLVTPIIKSGKVFHSPLFTIRFVQTADSTKIAAIVPVKASKTAVGRNQLRRAMYDSIAVFFEKTKKGTQAIVIAKPAAPKSTRAQINADMRGLFVKAGLIV